MFSGLFCDVWMFDMPLQLGRRWDIVQGVKHGAWGTQLKLGGWKVVTKLEAHGWRKNSSGITLLREVGVQRDNSPSGGPVIHSYATAAPCNMPGIPETTGSSLLVSPALLGHNYSGPRSRWQLMMDPCGGTGQWLWTILASDGGSWSWGQLTIDWLQQDSLIYSVPPLLKT